MPPGDRVEPLAGIRRIGASSRWYPGGVESWMAGGRQDAADAEDSEKHLPFGLVRRQNPHERLLQIAHPGGGRHPLGDPKDLDQDGSVHGGRRRDGQAGELLEIEGGVVGIQVDDAAPLVALEVEGVTVAHVPAIAAGLAAEARPGVRSLLMKQDLAGQGVAGECGPPVESTGAEAGKEGVRDGMSTVVLAATTTRATMASWVTAAASSAGNM